MAPQGRPQFKSRPKRNLSIAEIYALADRSSPGQAPEFGRNEIKHMKAQQERHQCVIVGGGFAGIEAALYLKSRLDGQADVTIISASDRFTYRPFLTYIPFGLSPERVSIDLDGIARAHDVRLVMGHVDRVDPEASLVHFGSRALPFDSLILATGARIVTGAIPKIPQGYTVWDEKEMLRLRGRLTACLNAAMRGEQRRIVFLIPPDAAWTGPTYELALMLATWASWQGVAERFEISLYTAEKRHLEALGMDLHEHVGASMARHDITVETGRTFRRVDHGQITLGDGRIVPFDVLISAAGYMGGGPTDGLPVDERGFLRTRPETRQLVSHDHIYAAGDGSDFPVKQGFLGLLQADAAAEHIASRVLEVEPEFGFRPDLFWVMEGLDEILVAHGDRDDVDLKRLPSGRLRRLEALSYLPQNQRLGNPLYSGLLWKGTEIGLRMLRHLKDAETQRPSSNRRGVSTRDHSEDDLARGGNPRVARARGEGAEDAPAHDGNAHSG